MKDGKQKTIKTIIGFVVGLTVMTLVQQGCSNQISFDKAMMEAASELNTSCPIMVDGETRLDNAMALPDKVFQYNYTLINMEKASVNIDELASYLEPIIVNNVKTNPDLKIYRDNKITMAYYYKDKNGVYLTKIEATPDKYKN